jgi:hypothetical protein
MDDQFFRAWGFHGINSRIQVDCLAQGKTTLLEQGALINCEIFAI